MSRFSSVIRSGGVIRKAEEIGGLNVAGTCGSGRSCPGGGAKMKERTQFFVEPIGVVGNWLWLPEGGSPTNDLGSGGLRNWDGRRTCLRRRVGAGCEADRQGCLSHSFGVIHQE